MWNNNNNNRKNKKKKTTRTTTTTNTTTTITSSSLRITAKIVLYCAVYTHSRPAGYYAKILNLKYLQGFLLCVTHYRTDM